MRAVPPLAVAAVVLLFLVPLGGAVAGPVHPATPTQPPPPNGKYPLTIRETGLPTGTLWTFQIMGTETRVTTAATVVQEPGGLVVVTFFPAGISWQPNQTTETVFVGPAQNDLNVTYTYNQSTIPGLEQSGDDNNSSTGLFGLPSPQGIIIVAVAVLGALALVSVLLIQRRGRRRRPASKTTDDDEAPAAASIRAGKSKPRPTKDERRRAQRRREERAKSSDEDPGTE